jgi:hypothetical protein
VSTVGLDVTPERRHLMHNATVVQHADRSEVDADRNRTPEQLSHLIRRGRGREVPIQVRVAEERVPNGAPDAPGLEPGCFEPFRDKPNGLRRIYHCRKPRRRSGVDLPVSFVVFSADDVPSRSRSPDIFRPCQSTPKS